MWPLLGRVKFQKAVNYGHKVILLAGVDLARLDDSWYTFSIFTFNPTNGKWRKIETTGHHPPEMMSNFEFEAQVVGDKLYVIPTRKDSWHSWQSGVYVLDLKSREWMKAATTGVPPVEVMLSSSWVWQDRIYLFGGMGDDLLKKLEPEQDQVSSVFSMGRNMVNQLVALDMKTLSWGWPRLGGDKAAPAPRSVHASCVSGEHVLLFGGGGGGSRLNDLHSLHLPTHTWRRLQNSGGTTAEAPPALSGHSLTLVGGNRAVLHGGKSYDWETLSDTWLLTWTVSRDRIQNVLWRKLCGQLKLYKRCFHAAKYRADTSRLYFFGGIDEAASVSLSHCFHILVSPQCLWEASLSVIVKKRVYSCSKSIPATLWQIIQDRKKSSRIHWRKFRNLNDYLQLALALVL